MTCLFTSDFKLLVAEEDYGIGVETGGILYLPRARELRSVLPHVLNGCTVNGGSAYTSILPEGFTEYGPQFKVVELRPMYSVLPSDSFAVACKCRQMLHWNIHSRYCPRCGVETNLLAENAKKCPKCGFEIYPNLSPAVIVRITRGEEVFLVRAKNFRSNHYGLVAGFVEAGESIESAVYREVREETGLEISNLRYYGSQPWPFPSGLMLGFTAEYKGGQIKLQEEELVTAGFFGRDNLPPLPDKMSIARRLIDEWVEAKK